MTSSLLTEIESPADLKRLELDQLADLARQLRQEILRVTARNGGHLATNLGAVELTVALHHVFDSPRDRIIWDVGNQCYAHKLVTGRARRFATIRTSAGLSGFVNRRESPHDHLTAGHAATALSAALGIAAARDYRGEDYRVVAVVGDGALTAGLSYEALNNLGACSSQLLVVLNDNSFSIAPSRGALSRRLRQARDRVLDGNLFEQLAIEYLGPLDGHDLPLLIQVLREAGAARRPAVLHLVTQKGRGYAPSERDPERYHGVPAFDLRTGRPREHPAAPSYSELFGRELLRIAAQDARVMAVTAAMPAGTGLADFAARFPKRFFDVGIAEQHAVTFAAGLAAAGCRPVVAIYSTFLQRSYDQVIHDVCLQDLPVTFVLDRAGIVGADGATHHGVFDLSYLRAVPRMVVMAPKDGQELARMIRAAIAHPGPAAVRFPRGRSASSGAPRGATPPLEIGRGELLRQGSDVALVAIGSMVRRALSAARALAAHGVSASVVNARFVKPLDAALILRVARQVRRLYTLEENVRHGGFGSAVLELLAEHQLSTPVTVLALPDEFIEHGATDQLLAECGLSAAPVVARVLAELGGRRPAAPAPVPQAAPGGLREKLAGIGRQTLPRELRFWVEQYAKVGQRAPFLWKWCLQGVDLTTLSCVDPDLRAANRVTKVLGVMFDVLLDDVADESTDARYLEALLRIPFARRAPRLAGFSRARRAYARTARRLWATIAARARRCPRYAEFRALLRFDYLQLLNTMRYAHLLNRDPRLASLVEHDLYLPHNMHMMVSGTLDLMCSPGFDHAELGRVRAALWHAQCMGRIGNLITTWERELARRDFTSGVFAFALQQGLLSPRELLARDSAALRKRIAAHDCEAFFLKRWQEHRRQITALSGSVRTVDINKLLAGLEQLLQLHLDSRGLK